MNKKQLLKELTAKIKAHRAAAPAPGTPERSIWIKKMGDLQTEYFTTKFAK
jgi:hypothetical protein